jgi:hypothetical protein
LPIWAQILLLSLIVCAGYGAYRLFDAIVESNAAEVLAARAKARAWDQAQVDAEVAKLKVLINREAAESELKRKEYVNAITNLKTTLREYARPQIIKAPAPNNEDRF